jgi:DNA repair exonuclease SbcCD ATPase subunit
MNTFYLFAGLVLGLVLCCGAALWQWVVAVRYKAELALADRKISDLLGAQEALRQNARDQGQQSTRWFQECMVVRQKLEKAEKELGDALDQERIASGSWESLKKEYEKTLAEADAAKLKLGDVTAELEALGRNALASSNRCTVRVKELEAQVEEMKAEKAALWRNVDEMGEELKQWQVWASRMGKGKTGSMGTEWAGLTGEGQRKLLGEEMEAHRRCLIELLGVPQSEKLLMAARQLIEAEKAVVS